MLRLPAEFEAVVDMAFGYSQNRLERIASDNIKVAHYTTSENAIKIIKGRELWLRNASVMNDFSEVSHGAACLDHCLHGPLGDRFRGALDRAYEGLYDRLKTLLETNDAKTQTYMVSLAEHESDDELGRLSMWRAYGGSTSGAALIFHPDIFNSGQVSLGCYASPVLYGGKAKFAGEFEKVVLKLEDGTTALRRLDLTTCLDIIYRALRFAILSSKHEGFEDERELRILCSPFGELSDWIKRDVEVVRGIPQLVYKIPLENKQGMNAPALSLNRMIHKIIVGPTLYPNEVRAAFVHLLRTEGIEEPENRVAVSNIPLRQWG